MGQSIKNGRNGTLAKVDLKNRVHTFCVSRDVNEQATIDEGSYNINSGLVTLTTAGESGILYVKNGENVNFAVTDIVVIMGPTTGGSATDTTHIRVYKNSTTGTLISAASAVNVNSNRDFGSSETLADSLAYQGVTGSTITDGSVHIESLVSPGNRVSFAIDEILRKGNSISVSLEPNDSNTSMKCMVALIGHQQINTDDQ